MLPLGDVASVTVVASFLGSTRGQAQLGAMVNQYRTYLRLILNVPLV